MALSSNNLSLFSFLLSSSIFFISASRCCSKSRSSLESLSFSNCSFLFISWTRAVSVLNEDISWLSSVNRVTLIGRIQKLKYNYLLKSSIRNCIGLLGQQRSKSKAKVNNFRVTLCFLPKHNRYLCPFISGNGALNNSLGILGCNTGLMALLVVL